MRVTPGFFFKEKNSSSSFLCPIFPKKILFFCVCVFLVSLSECCHVDDRRDWTLILLEPELCENLFELFFFSLLLHQNSWQCNGVLLPLLLLKFSSFYHHLPRWIKSRLKNKITIQKQKKIDETKTNETHEVEGLLYWHSYFELFYLHCLCVCVFNITSRDVVRYCFSIAEDKRIGNRLK